MATLLLATGSDGFRFQVPIPSLVPFNLHTLFLGGGTEFQLLGGAGCTLGRCSDVVIQQEGNKRRKAKGEDIVWVQSVFAIFHIGSFYERSKNKTTVVADSICTMQENNKEEK